MPFVALIALLVGEAAFLVAVFGGTNVRIENPWVFFGGVAVAVASAVVVWLAERRS